MQHARLTIESRIDLDGTSIITLCDVDRSIGTFAAGQYLSIVDSDGTNIPFSVASAPHHLPTLVLHHQPVANHPDNARLARLFAQDELLVTLPAGKCHLTDQQRRTTLVLIGAGSGIAQINAIAEDLIFRHDEPRSQVHVFHGVREPALAYQHKEWQRRAAEHQWLHYQRVVSEPPAGFVGSIGLVGDVVAATCGQWLAGAVTVIAGGPPAVYGIYDALAPAGLLIGQNVFSDVFDYAPRDESAR